MKLYWAYCLNLANNFAVEPNSTCRKTVSDANYNNNNSSRSSAKAPQQNTYKPQIVHRIGENKMKIQATGVKCKMKQSKQVFHKMSKTIRSP